MATRDTYTKVHEDWKNQPDETTPVYAEDLEHIEQGIKDAADKRALKDIYDDNAINLGKKSGTTVGENSTALGKNNEVNGESNYSDGENNEVSGKGSHAEGGWNVMDYAFWSHVEGLDNLVSGNRSHAEGYHTIAAGDNQHVSGMWNVEDKNSQYAVIVGGGDDNTQTRKNIYTLDWFGNLIVSGDVKNGAGVSLNSLKSAIDNISTGGGVTAKVFDTKADLDAWLAVEGNADTLVVGQNIYIKATNTPDYWWDGTGLQILETDKVEIESMTYNETMSILNATAEEVA